MPRGWSADRRARAEYACAKINRKIDRKIDRAP
jgi:hypothetical protein